MAGDIILMFVYGDYFIHLLYRIKTGNRYNIGKLPEIFKSYSGIINHSAGKWFHDNSCNSLFPAIFMQLIFSFLFDKIERKLNRTEQTGLCQFNGHLQVV